MNTLADQWMRQGKDEGEQIGELRGLRTTLLNLSTSKFEYVPVGFSQKINAINDLATLNALSLSLLKTDSLEAFEALVDKASKPSMQ